MTDRELLQEIDHLCRRYAHCGVNMVAHALASKIATAIEKHLGEECGQGESGKQEVGHG